MQLTSSIVKQQALTFGADLCGIAPIDRFNDCVEKGTLTKQNSPSALFPDAKAVIVVAKRFLRSTTLIQDSVPYTVIRNWISSQMDDITSRLSGFIEDTAETNEIMAFPTGAVGPDSWNAELQKNTGFISLKNAARLAGLGVIGKNTLLLTPQYGNMVWLGAVITNLPLEGDALIPAEKNPCSSHCSKCIDNCPSHALDGSAFIDQNKCFSYAFGEPASGGEWRLKCHKCRSICPFSSRGFKL